MQPIGPLVEFSLNYSIIISISTFTRIAITQVSIGRENVNNNWLINVFMVVGIFTPFWLGNKLKVWEIDKVWIAVIHQRYRD